MISKAVRYSSLSPRLKTIKRPVTSYIPQSFISMDLTKYFGDLCDAVDTMLAKCVPEERRWLEKAKQTFEKCQHEAMPPSQVRDGILYPSRLVIIDQSRRISAPFTLDDAPLPLQTKAHGTKKQSFRGRCGSPLSAATSSQPSSYITSRGDAFLRPLFLIICSRSAWRTTS